MRKIFTTRRRVVIAGATVVALMAGAGTAYAFFTGGGSGTGTGSVGTAAGFTIAQSGTTSGGPLSPGGPSETLTFTVTNNSGQDQVLNSLTPSIKADGTGDVFAGSSSIGGCLATWFTPTIASGPTTPVTVPASGFETYTVTLTMPADSADNQDKCQGINGPTVVLTANQGS